MAERLNKVIELIEAGKPAFGPFVPAGSIPDATWIASSNYDFVVYELEHNAFNLSELRLSLQFMLDRRQIVESGSLAPQVTPLVRIPVNGREQSQWIVKQVLDIGVYGIVFPMINTPEDAVAALQAARYIQAADAPIRNRSDAADTLRATCCATGGSTNLNTSTAPTSGRSIRTARSCRFCSAKPSRE